jgi:flavodoxin
VAVNRTDELEDALIQMLLENLEDEMIQIDPGTILEREYKGNNIKVKVLKDGSFSYNGKQFEDRGSLMKAILKGKTGQFTNFFKLNGEDKPKKSKKVAVSTDDSTEGIGSDLILALDSHIRNIVEAEVNKILSAKFGGN